MIFAVDTETDGVDPTAQSPVGNGTVVCFSIYCGPTVDFSEFGETLDLSDVASKVAAVANEAPTRKEEAAAHKPVADDGAVAAAAPVEANISTLAPKRTRKAAADKKDKQPAEDAAFEYSNPAAGATAAATVEETQATRHAPDGAAAASSVAPDAAETASATTNTQTLLTSTTESHSEEETAQTTLKDAMPASKSKITGKSKRLWVDTAGKEGEEVMQIFKPWLENPKYKKVFHNWSFDSHMFANHQVLVKGFASSLSDSLK